MLKNRLLKVTPVFQNTTPLKAVVLTRDQLKEFAKQLAHTQEIGTSENYKHSLIVSSLYKNQLELIRINGLFTQALQKNRSVMPPSTEWLLDNFYIINQQIQSAKNDLSKGFYNNLPKLKNGFFKGYPRVYSIAYELLNHTDNRLDKELLIDFILSYESVIPLTSAELWALPIMLKIVWIENLKRLMSEAESTFKKRSDARLWADKFINNTGEIKSPETLNLSELFYKNTNPDSVFLIWLLRSLRDQDAKVTPIIRWLELYSEQEDINIEEIVKADNQKQAANRVSAGNIVSSMRLISSLDWATIFEDISFVEKILKQDPSKIYSKMDFKSRDRYRHVVEKLSKFSKLNEQEVARRVIKLASIQFDLSQEISDKKTHIGYYLIDKGQDIFKKDLKYTPSFSESILENISKYPSIFYIFSIIFLSTIGFGLIAIYLFTNNISWIVSFLFIIPLSVPAVSIVNKLIVSLFEPTTPPKLEFKESVPDEYRTIVIVPCLLANIKDIDELTNALEKRYLANRDKNIVFGLLTDFADSSSKNTKNDDELILKMQATIKTLNKKYQNTQNDIFYLFHRERLFNEREKIWMGWERKRGKIEEFNKLLLGNDNTSYKIITGDLSFLRTIKFVITVDADTQMPLNTAKKLIGTISHPLNRPVIDPVLNKVVEGYGIIQPRVDVHAPSAAKSLFTKIYASESGLDPYHSVISNVYQDLFHNASYIGKGIYDLNAFNYCLSNRFPDNHLLSHDLLEGSYLRVGLATDIELLEDFPTTYSGFSKRQHRWIRGDWQILPWLLPKVPTHNGTFTDNVLNAQDKWKIFDNLRRSLITPISTITLLYGWVYYPQISFSWTLIILSLVNLPLIHVYLDALSTRLPGEEFKNYLSAINEETKKIIQRGFISVSLSSYESFRNINAIFLATQRITFKTKGVLEWTSHSFVESEKNDINTYFKVMSPSIGLGLVSLWFTLFNSQEILAFIISLTWIVSPFVLNSISKPLINKSQKLSRFEDEKLQLISRKIWRFFDEYVNEENNFLPPDNIQMTPSLTIARRTSPTNIGFYILSTISAYDFGFINKKTLVKKLTKTVKTLEKLTRFKGHFFNWYKIDDLSPLHPAYISTVDSGNLAASLLTARQACIEISKNNQDENILKNGLLITWNAWINEWSKLNKISQTSELTPKTIPIIENENFNKIIDEVLSQLKDTKNNLEKTDFKDIKKMLPELKVLFHFVKQKELESKNFIDDNKINDVSYWRKSTKNLLTFSRKSILLSKKLINIASKCNTFANELEFEFLFNIDRKSFSIGYNVDENILDDSYYNLLASEARMTSFLAIAMGQIPEQHWFDLGRPLVKIKSKTTLLSWGGTMFEYLMPDLLMKNYENTLLHQTSSEIIDAQIEYAKTKSIPWGISESGYYAFDYQYNYQYQQFGVPNLSLKLELAENLVVSPYSTFLALSQKPLDAYENLTALENLGMVGTLGFYEAVDFNPHRVPKNENIGIVKSYMAHHQGMSLVALNNYFNSEIMQKRFHQNELVVSVELLLGEKIPMHVTKTEMPQKEIPSLSRDISIDKPSPLTLTGKTETIRTTVVSNAQYSVIVSNGGTGYSILKDLDITRWQVDATDNNWGWFCFIKDVQTNDTWSATYQPYLKKPDQYSVSFLPYKAEFSREDNKIETKTNVFVAADANVEIREVILTNRNSTTKRLEITDYAEVVGLKHKADSAHPAFGKLFVESEYDEKRQSLLFKRRIRQKDDEEVWIWHTLRGESEKINIAEYETDRNNFLGRGNTIFHADAFENPLQNSSGATLDPIMSIRAKIVLSPNETKKIFFVTGVNNSKSSAQILIDKFRDPGEVQRTLKLSEIHSQIELRHLGITQEEAKLFQKIGSRIIYPDRYSRAKKDILSQNTKGQSALYPYGISGDYPIVLVKIKSLEDLKLVKESLLAHEFLRMKNVFFDLIVLNEHQSVYSGDIKEAVQSLIDTSLSRPLVDKPGGIYLRDVSLLATGDKILFETIARLVLDSELGSLEDIFELIPRSEYKQKVYDNPREINIYKKSEKQIDNPKSFSANFSPDGSEYIISSTNGGLPPHPWSNVIANENFGTLLTSGGLGYSWSLNSQLNRITSWSNDPVSEKPGEIIYFKDVKENFWWSATPLPSNNKFKYVTKHGWGYSTYICKNKEINIETNVWVDQKDPVKIIHIKLKNETKLDKNIKIIHFSELVMGDSKEQNQFFIVTKFDPSNESFTAHNSYNSTFSEHVTFAQTNEKNIEYSGDRSEFIGRGGSWANPIYLQEEQNTKLSNKAGAGLDPAIILEKEINIRPFGEKEIIFVLGQAKNDDEYQILSAKYKDIETAKKSLEIVKKSWQKRLSIIKINTPSANTNTLFNGWLIYQVLSARFWARSAFYQSGGAFGFRDQLQDVLALLYCNPEITRQHILYAAEHQFIQGDVMHWWHPFTTKGVRTKISDDFLWLPFAVQKYVTVTHDNEILNESLSFMDMETLNEFENERYDEALATHEKASLYAHCIRALENGMKTGKHGLPLMGHGDWNDGLNNVGESGHGESIWLGWFQYNVYSNFAKICKERKDKHNSERYSKYAKQILDAIEKHGWDEDWYKRAYFDNGEVLGSKSNTEASIDSISQSWSVVSGAPINYRAHLALESAEKHLVNKDKKIIMLLDPPFNNSNPFPGYIRGYLPGIRENGGQYTHGSVWLPLAYAMLGNGDKAFELIDYLNPINHTDTVEKINEYKGEPYVMAGDVYSNPQRMAEAGWTWYTGSASWMYKIILENILGLTLSGDELSFSPCIPKDWDKYEISYTKNDTIYNIEVLNPKHVQTGVTQFKFDNKIVKNKKIILPNDQKSHIIEITM